jgi:hypothetical protein
VEKIKQTLQKQITQLNLENELPQTKCLPIALLRIRTAPRKYVGLSSYEMLYGLLYLDRTGDLSTMENKDQFLRNYILAIGTLMCQIMTPRQ